MGIKTSELDPIEDMSEDDYFVVLTDPSGIPKTGLVAKSSIIENSTPTNSSVEALRGKFFFDDNYLYIAIDDNQLKRIPLQSF